MRAIAWAILIFALVVNDESMLWRNMARNAAPLSDKMDEVRSAFWVGMVVVFLILLVLG